MKLIILGASGRTVKFAGTSPEVCMCEHTVQSNWPSWRHLALIAVVYAALSVVELRPITNVLELRSASYPGDARLNIWTLAWVDHAVLSGNWNIFDANIFYPTTNTLSYSEHLFSLSVVTLPIYALTNNPTLAYNVAWFAAFVLNGLAAHLLLWRYTRNHYAALASGISYAFSFFNMLHGHGHIQLVWSFGLPVSLLLLDQWFTRGTWSTMFALIGLLLVQILASWYLAVLAAFVVSSYAIVHTLRKRFRPFRHYQPLVQVAVGLLAVSACVVPFALHYRGFPPATPRELLVNSADLSSFLVPSSATWLGARWPNWLPGLPRAPYGESALFVGYSNLLLTALALWAVLDRSPTSAPLNAQRRLIAFSLFLIFAGGWLAMGPSSGPHGLPRPFNLVLGIPGLSAFRAPARFGLLVTLGLSITTGFGAGYLWARGRPGQILLATMLLVMLSESYLLRFPGGRPQPEIIPAAYHFLRTVVPGPVVSLPIHRATPLWWRDADYQLYSTVHWLPIVNGFSRREPDTYFSIVGHMTAFPGPNSANTMRRLGIRYVVVHTARYSGHDGDAIIQEADKSPDFDRLARFGQDFVYRVRSSKGAQ